MLIQILKGTPTWVFVLFFALIAIGVLQSRSRRLSVAQVAMLPAAFIAFSLFGVVSAFGARPVDLAAWATGMIAAGTAVRLVLGTGVAQWESATRSFHVPGTWIPLALMMAIFFARYAISVTLALHPELSREALFALCASFAYGALSGMFLGRALAILASRKSATAAYVQ
jgi:hypothetical protein